MTLDELRELDFNDIAGWPRAVRWGSLAVLALVILALAWWLFWSEQMDQLSQARHKEEELRQTFLAKSRQAVNLDAYKRQYAEIQKTLDTFLTQLPGRSEMDQLLSSINQAGVNRGLQFELFRPDKQETMNDFYAELPIAIRVGGPYQSMGAFVSDVARLPRIVTLSDIAIQSNDKGQLTMDAVAHTYRYLDEAEMAAQKKAAAAAKKAKK